MIRTKYLLVVDEAGDTKIFASGNGGGTLTLWSETGKEVVRLYADEHDNGVVEALNRKGEGRTLTP